MACQYKMMRNPSNHKTPNFEDLTPLLGAILCGGFLIK